MLIQRPAYLNQLLQWKDKPLIKVVTGIRRSGKSELLGMLRSALLSEGVPAGQIISANFESFTLFPYRQADELYHWVVSQAKPGIKTYILLDEIQEVKDWEKAVNALRVDLDADIYITGSNSHLLSSELASLLTGRYVEIPVYTLSFAEFIQFSREKTRETNITVYSLFEQYLRKGGFPVIHIADYEQETARQIVFDLYSSAILRDTVQRWKIRDVELLERVVRYVFDNIGNTFSAQNVADYFKSQHRKVDLNTIYNYLSALESAFILYKVSRYDLRGKSILKTLEKYYAGDTSLVYSVLGYRDRYISGMLENILLLELKRRGYSVYTGKWEDREVDFIAEQQEKRIYLQVAWKMEKPETVDREFIPLLHIKDHFPKYVLTLDEFWRDNIEGIRHMHMADFLLLEHIG